MSFLSNKLCIYLLDLELTIDPAPQGEFSGLWSSYTLWYVAFRKKMIANLCWGFKELWAFKIRYHLNIAIFCIVNTKTPMHQVI